MTTLIDAVAEIMAEHGVPCEKLGSHIIGAGIRGEQHSYDFYALLSNGNIITFLLVFQEKIPADRRVPLAEVMMHVNSILVIGNFEVHLEDGDARYRVGLDAGGELRSDTVGRLIERGLECCDIFHDNFMRVAFEGASLADL